MGPKEHTGNRIWKAANATVVITIVVSEHFSGWRNRNPNVKASVISTTGKYVARCPKAPKAMPVINRSVAVFVQCTAVGT